ncbi:hypothetical protein PMAYCL1PPCAC_21378, partial [Pristionchus mayeri]
SMVSGRLLQSFLLLVFLSAGTNAFVFSCEEVKYRLINQNYEANATFACIFTEEGFNNWAQLKKIEFATYSISLADISQPGGCISRKPDEPTWRLISTPGTALDCKQEFTIIYTSDVPQFSDALTDVRQTRITNKHTFVQPRNIQWLHTEQCLGTGNVTIATGAGLGEKEERFDMISWPCGAVPDWIFTFDNVYTVYVDAGITWTVEFSRNPGDAIHNPVTVERGDHLVLFTSGRCDDLQNLAGRTDNREYIRLGNWDYMDVSVVMNVVMDTDNSGSVALQKYGGGPTFNYYNGTHTDSFNTDYFEIRYEPKGKDPAEIWNSQDNIIFDIQIGPKR